MMKKQNPISAKQLIIVLKKARRQVHETPLAQLVIQIMDSIAIQPKSLLTSKLSQFRSDLQSYKIDKHATLIAQELIQYMQAQFVDGLYVINQIRNMQKEAEQGTMIIGHVISCTDSSSALRQHKHSLYVLNGTVALRVKPENFTKMLTKYIRLASNKTMPKKLMPNDALQDEELFLSRLLKELNSIRLTNDDGTTDVRLGRLCNKVINRIDVLITSKSKD